MSRIAFFCIPAHGHTNPTLAVVRELIRRGHQVRYYSYEPMREKILSTGAEFIPCDRYDAQQKLSPADGAKVGRDLAFSTKLLVDTTLALEEGIGRELEDFAPHCVVADSMALWGKAAALKMDIPHVCSCTTFAFNKQSSASMKKSGMELLAFFLSMPKVNRQVRRLKVRGYPIKSILDIIGNDNDTHTIVYTSPQFQPFYESFSENYVFVGPLLREPTQEIEKRREKLVYISMGTVNNSLLPLYKSCIEALGESGYQVIMSMGERLDMALLGPLPDNIEAYAYVDQMAVLKKADCFISHGGMNSVSESLYYSVPLVLLPNTPEQEAVAKRAEELGAGIMPAARDAGSLRRSVDRILEDRCFADSAAEIAAGFRRCPGAAAAADKILRLCK